MSWRQAASATQAAASVKTRGKMALRRNFGDSQRMKAVEERLGRIAIEFRIGRLDAEEESIARCTGERRHVEHRVVRPRQPVQRKHADKRRQRGAKDRALKRHRNEV